VNTADEIKQLRQEVTRINFLLMQLRGSAGPGAAHNLLSAMHADSTPASPVLGDVIVAGAAPAWKRKAGNITATRKFLRQVGTGAVSDEPEWDTLQPGDLMGALNPLSGGTPLEYWRHWGATNYVSWYAPTFAPGTTTGTMTKDQLYAVPFSCPKNITLDRIACRLNTAVAGNARIGIYTDGGNIYPASLVLDAGTISTAAPTGLKTLTINQALVGPALYWLVIVFSANTSMVCSQGGGTISIVGFFDPTVVATIGLWAAFAYGALPANFPGSPTLVSVINAFWVRLSA